MRTVLASLALAAALAHTSQVNAETFFVAPKGAVVSGVPDGSQSKPFASVGDAFGSGKVKGGDTILLKDGSHGGVALYQTAFSTPVTIASQNGKQAHVDWIAIRGSSSNLTFERLTVWPTEVASVPSKNLVETSGEASKIVFRNLDIRSASDAANYLQWTAATWNARVVHGIALGGRGDLAEGNQLTAIYSGIMLNGPGTMAVNNVIDGFNGDALRPLGDNTVLRGNLVKNCVATDENHDDGIQSFKAGGGVIAGIVIDQNTILEWTAAPNHPLRCSLQGMFLADATYDNLLVTNNLVATSQYHGITLSGGRNSKIVNNTVVNIKGETGPYPWLKIWDTPTPVNVLVANNLAMSLSAPAVGESAVKFRNNSVIGTPATVFEQPSSHNYLPKASSGFIDSADPTLAPVYDNLGVARPSGAAPDRGAFEVVQGTPPVQPTPTPTPSPTPVVPPPVEPTPVQPPPPVEPPPAVVPPPPVVPPVVSPPSVRPPGWGLPFLTPPTGFEPRPTKPTTPPPRPGFGNNLRDLIRSITGR